MKDYQNETITLNSSPYGLPFYKVIGFMPTDEEKTVNGIRFTPMEYVAELDVDMLRDYHSCEVWGRKNRRLELYGIISDRNHI